MTRLFALVLLLGAFGCDGSQLFGRPVDLQAYWLPLTVELRFDPTVMEAAVEYPDACGQPRTQLLREHLITAFKKQLGLAFERVTIGASPTGAAPSAGADATVEIALGFKEVQLSGVRQGDHTYPATILLGATGVFINPAGNVIYSKSLRTEVRGDVSTESKACGVRGMEQVARDASEKLAEGFKKLMGTSPQVREFAEAKERRRSAGMSLPVSLSFRVELEDENRDQMMEAGESLAIQAEIGNPGPTAVKDVAVHLGGTPALVQQFSSPIAVGTLEPGGARRIEMTGKLPVVMDVQETELLVSLRESSLDRPALAERSFRILVQPNAMGNVDVDHVPAPIAGSKRKAVGIAVGIEAYRHPGISGVPFAARDAEVMAEYFRAVAGVPDERLKVVTNEHALKGDLVEVFEDWLPQQAAADTVVLIFVAGRAQVDSRTGAVSLLPHEADGRSPGRLFSMRRLYDLLGSIPMQRVVLLLDLTLTPASMNVPDGKKPVWGPLPPSLRSAKLIQFIRTSATAESRQLEARRHGRFTYVLLKGLQGQADRDRNGQVVIGELCDYVRGEMSEMKETGQDDPGCLPDPAPKEKASGFPVARVK